MPCREPTARLISIPNRPPFDQFKVIQPLAKVRRGHVSVESARHHLYVANDRQSHDSVLIKITSKPGLTYQENLKNEIASLLKINGSIPESRYFPLVRTHGKLRDGSVLYRRILLHRTAAGHGDRQGTDPRQDRRLHPNRHGDRQGVGRASRSEDLPRRPESDEYPAPTGTGQADHQDHRL